MTLHIEQPAPVVNDHPSIQSLVRRDLAVRTHLGAHRHGVRTRVAEREQVGIARYGTALQAGNGRDALRDLEEEILDGANYAKQAIVEAEATRPDDVDLPRLRSMYEDLLHMACALRQIRTGRS